MKKVSFDFDDTLSFLNIQEYAKKLIKENIEVHITTSRYENLDDYLPIVWPGGHKDLFDVAKELNIPKEHIHFTNMKYKCEFFIGSDFIWHMDDNNHEIFFINQNTSVTGIQHLTGGYEYMCNELLNLTHLNT